MSDDKAKSNGPREFEMRLSGQFYGNGMVYREYYRADISVEPYEIEDGQLPANKTIRVIEKSAYDAMKARAEEERRAKVQIQIFYDQMKITAKKERAARERLEKRVEAMRASLEHLAKPDKIHDKEWTCTIDARAALAEDDAAKEKP